MKSPVGLGGRLELLQLPILFLAKKSLFHLPFTTIQKRGSGVFTIKEVIGLKRCWKKKQ